MKKRLLAALLVATMCLTLTACGGSSDPSDSSDDKKQNTSSEGNQTDTKEEQEKDDGIINFGDGNYNITYTRHETGTDYEGKSCLLFYYNFTNTKEEGTLNAMTCTSVKAFQNGVECEHAVIMDSNETIDNYMKDIQPGTTIEVCQAFILSDTSEITVEASDWISVDDEKDTQLITLQ